MFANNPAAAAKAKEAMLTSNNTELLDGLQAQGVPVSSVSADAPLLAAELKVIFALSTSFYDHLKIMINLII